MNLVGGEEPAHGGFKVAFADAGRACFGFFSEQGWRVGWGGRLFASVAALPGELFEQFEEQFLMTLFRCQLF